MLIYFASKGENMEKVYGFTNEFVAAYPDIYITLIMPMF